MNSNALCQTALLVGAGLLLAGSSVSCSDATPKSSAASSSTVWVGMSFGQAAAALAAVGARRRKDCYHLPWWSKDGNNSGYHIYYALPEGTCLCIGVQSSPAPSSPYRSMPVRDPPPEESEADYEIVSFEMGPKGQGYPGKMQWFSDGDAGKHTYPQQLDLTDFQM